MTRAAPSAGLESGSVTARTEQGVTTIEFGHPKSNSLPGALLRRMSDAVDRAAADDGTRVVVLRSTGTGPFCAGASFDELKTLSDAVAGQEFFMGFARLILAMRRCPKLIVARVHGKIVGGGVGVVAAADHAIATTRASARLSELAIGIGPFVVGPVIERRIGRGAFQALAVDAATWRDAAWAERHGLFADVVPDDVALDAAVDGLAGRLAASSPDAMARLKTVFWEGTEDWDRLLEARAALSGALVLSPPARRAIAAAAVR